jgi:hypothetical protein
VQYIEFCLQLAPPWPVKVRIVPPDTGPRVGLKVSIFRDLTKEIVLKGCDVILPYVIDTETDANPVCGT